MFYGHTSKAKILATYELIFLCPSDIWTVFPRDVLFWIQCLFWSFIYLFIYYNEEKNKQSKQQRHGRTGNWHWKGSDEEWRKQNDSHSNAGKVIIVTEIRWVQLIGCSAAGNGCKMKTGWKMAEMILVGSIRALLDLSRQRWKFAPNLYLKKGENIKNPT